MADGFDKPKLLNIDISNWTGQPGQTIRIQAQDDTVVARVHVVIADANGNILEQEEAEKADGLWWGYDTATQVSMKTSPTVTVTTEDLPGNKAEMTWQNN